MRRHGAHLEFLFLKNPRFLNRDVLVGGLDQFAGRRALEADDFDAAAVHLQVFDQRHVIAVAGDQGHAVELLRHRHGVDGQADFPGTFRGAGRAAVGVGANLQFLDFQFVAEAAERLVEPGLVDVRLLNDVRDRPDQLARAGDLTQQPAVIDFALVQQFCGVEHVLNVDENAQALRECARNQRGL